jgi:hypothetical protein
MEELIYGLLGLYIIYSYVHLILLQKISWEWRTGYQKFVTVFAFVSIGLTFLGLIFP